MEGKEEREERKGRCEGKGMWGEGRRGREGNGIVLTLFYKFTTDCNHHWLWWWLVKLHCVSALNTDARRVLQQDVLVSVTANWMKNWCPLSLQLSRSIMSFFCSKLRPSLFATCSLIDVFCMYRSERLDIAVSNKPIDIDIYIGIGSAEFITVDNAYCPTA